MRRGIACLMLVLVICCSPARSEEALSADRLLKLENDEFERAADDMSYRLSGDYNVPYSADQLIAIAEKLLPGVVAIGVKRSDDHNPFGRYFSAACEKATYKQLDTLIDLYSRIDPGAFEKSEALPLLAARWIERETNAIRDKDRHFTLPPAVAETSDKFNGAPKDLVEGFKKYAGIKAAYEKAFPAPNERIDAYVNRKSFYETITAALRGSTDRKYELLKYAWTGTNCMGVTDIEDAQDIAMLLMLLRERRFDLALGAAFRVIGTVGSTSQPETVAGPIVRLCRALGIDWETIVSGAELDRIADSRDDFVRQPLIEILAAYGSDRGVLLLNELSHFAAKECRSQFVSAFDSLIPKDSSAKGVIPETYYGHRLNRNATEKLSKEVQALCLRTVEEFAMSDMPEQPAGEAVSIFARTQQRSSIPALRHLTQHPSTDVAGRAASVLSAIGEQAPLTNNDPVAFRIFINNEPLAAGTKIDWQVEHEDGSTISSLIDSEADGLVKLDRKHFVDAAKPVKVTFNGSYRTSGNEFTADIRPGGDLSRVTTVRIQASSLQIVLENQNSLNAPFNGRALLWMQQHSDKELGRSYWDSASKHEVVAEPSITIPNVQHGLYDVWIAVTGAEMWHQVVTVSQSMSPIEAVLKPGSEIRFSVVGPYGEMPYWGKLIKDGQPFEPQFDRDSSYRYLPCGNYILVLPGSEALDQRELDRRVLRGPDEVSFAGKQVPFTIVKGSPPVIDFGQIRLESVSH